MSTLTFPYPHFDRFLTRLEPEDVRAQYGVTDVYNMSANESPLGASPQVVTAVQEAAAALGRYPTMGDERLRQALAHTWGRGLTLDHFFTSCSGYEALELIGRSFLQPGDEVIISHPTFGIYNKLIGQEGATVVDVPLLAPDFRLDVAGILTAVNERTRYVLLCNPNNPTGTLTVTAEMMDHLVSHLPEHVLLVSDEVYLHFVTDDAFPDSLQYVLAGKNVVLVHTFSKAYGLPGLRLGYGIARPEIANYIGGMRRGYHQNHLALAAGVAALQDEAHMRQNVAVAVAQRNWLCAQLDEMGISYWPSQTNFVVMQLPMSGVEVAEALLAYGVMVKPQKGGHLENCLRVSVSVPAGTQQFVRGLREILDGAKA